MRIPNFFRIRKNIHGSIGYFGLEGWWLSDFDVNERKLIIEKYQPMGGGSLTEGKLLHTSQTAISLLWGMVGWFSQQDDRHIAYKLINKAEALIEPKTNPLDIHFLYSVKIEITYKDRDREPNGLDKAITACEQQILCSERASKEIHKKFRSDLPGHKGYPQLAIIREKQKDYDASIEVCEQAISQRWNGDWIKRIERCNKRKGTQ